MTTYDDTEFDDLLLQVDLAQNTFDPMPADLVHNTNLALTLALLEADLAVALEDDALAGVRTATRTPHLFTWADLEIAITCETRDTSQPHISGWVTWPGAKMQLVVNHAAMNFTADHHGRFQCDATHRGAGHLIVWPTEQMKGDPDHQRNPVVTPNFDV